MPKGRLLPGRTGARVRHRECLRPCARLGAAPELHTVCAGRQPDQVAVAAIDLRVKGEIGREALGLRGIDPALRVANHEAGHGRLAGLVAHAPAHRLRGAAVEGDRHRVSTPVDRRCQRALRPHELERQARAAPAGVAAVELEDAVLELETAQRLGQRLLVEHHQVEPAGLDLVLRSAGERERLLARPSKLGVGTRAVVHLHEKLPPAAFHQLRLRGPERHGRRRTGIDRHAGEAVRIEHSLDRLHSLRRAPELPAASRLCLSLAGRGEPR